MSNIAKSRGSKHLTGAAALRYRMPAMGDFPATDNSSVVEHQPWALKVVGSNPACQLPTHPCTGLSSR